MQKRINKIKLKISQSLTKKKKENSFMQYKQYKISFHCLSLSLAHKHAR